MSAKAWGPFKKAPNFLILISDQQSGVDHFPAGWAAKNLPVLTQLKAGGISFENSFISSAACSPSRGALWTGNYPQTTTVTETGGATLPDYTQLPNIASVLSSAGYEVVYKGKWHLSGNFVGFAQVRPVDVKKAAAEDASMTTNWGFASANGFSAWTSPDMGTELSASGPPNPNGTTPSNTLAGGLAANDERVVSGKGLQSNQQSAVDYLKNVDPKNKTPFCLTVSLVNPHDVYLYPKYAKEAGYDLSILKKSIYKNFKRPASYKEKIKGIKPSAQYAWLESFQGGPLGPKQADDYIRFYAYLQNLTDQLTGDVINAMSSKVKEDTIIIRISDHGEMTQAHGGLREKENSAYRETLHVPLIFSNPKLLALYNNKPVTSDALVSHVDFLPTLADIAQVPYIDTPVFQGKSYSSTLLDPSSPTQDDVLFTYDDADSAPDPVFHIRCIVSDHYKYAVYYDPTGNYCDNEYELYDYSTSGGLAETDNLLCGTVRNTTCKPPSKATKTLWQKLHTRLTKILIRTSTTPKNWPAIPPKI